MENVESLDMSSGRAATTRFLGMGCLSRDKWTIRRLIRAVRASPPWLRDRIVHGANVAGHFLRFLRGKTDRIDVAPAASKWGIVLRIRIDKKPFHPSTLRQPSDVWEDCSNVFESTGVWPISFSYPKCAPFGTELPQRFMCPLFPGHSYAYKEEPPYLRNYSRFAFALTQKKAGWDCFRHLEILYSGSMVYMPDAAKIPDYTMVHYPKEIFTDVAHHVNRSQGGLSPDARQAVLEYFNQHLTTKAMARYLLRASCAADNPRVLFVDEAAVLKVDYQSILTLIGLKQLLGNRAAVAFPVGYVYDDWDGDEGALYGRGFGYSRVLDSRLKNQNEVNLVALDLSAEVLAEFDLIVVGSVTRNLDLAHKLVESFPAEKTVWIHGEDRGPSKREISAYQRLHVNVFVRELGDN